MVISIPAPTAVVFFLLLLTSGILVIAIIRARQKTSELRVSLDAARQRQQDDERELTQRSALDSLKDEFVSTVSHELRTPLTSIRGALGLLSSGVFGNLDAKSQNLLRIALTNTDRLIRLINDLLDLERMDSGAAKLQMKRCSLPDLVNQAIETMSSLADAGQVKIAITPTAKVLLPNVFFDGDPDRVLQVLTNLFSNAIKFAPATSVVSFDVETPPDELIFRVIDQGRGIPEDQLESVFERFKQVDHPDARAIGGTGLGLAICRSIIQQHGGSIWAQRNVARGASICVRLPRHQRTYDASIISPQPISLVNPGISAAPASTGEVSSLPQQDSKPTAPILFCGANQKKRSMTALQLRASGHQVLETGTSDEALEIAKKQSPQLPLQALLVDLETFETKDAWFKILNRPSSAANVPLVVLSLGSSAGDANAPGDNRVDDASALRTLQPGEPIFSGLGPALSTERGPGRILLIEDDLDLASMVLNGFARIDVLIEHAATSYRAKALCRENRPDLVIIDLKLPSGEGYSLVEWLGREPAFCSLPLIAYSRYDLEESGSARPQVGLEEFFAKAKVPSRDIEQLLSAVVSQGRNTGNANGTSNSSARQEQPAVK